MGIWGAHRLITISLNAIILPQTGSSKDAESLGQNHCDPISESHLLVRTSPLEQRLAVVGKARGSNVAFVSLCPTEKPVSLTYRCPCRFYESNVARANIKHLKILSTPNCSLQIVARLKSNSKQVCIDPKLKWIQEYLEKALNKPRHRTHKKKQQKKRGPLCPSRATPLKSPGRKNGGSRCKRQAL
ncbi:PREDICTED: stromal cell-derived factor 1 [Tauraco erythrolophus]|uniref:stromal cell-derived factor 1 n=1 Tax=Tauraco erythrolophus TaxID=121530 RepID=UPI0005232599|nr:PREDICTED: stromal cell-derived factor 1 [Tauraco erythrolophus]